MYGGGMTATEGNIWDIRGTLLPVHVLSASRNYVSEVIQTQCCIVGGGPAGMMLGYLLARMGVDVAVLEKHKDFLRDFRGDTIHPSTLELMHELGILREFLQRPHQETQELAGQIGDERIT
jgi:NADPH-dependent 2,4-dienoyl-CoA reductase/sulfur reductase-like enzyme